jgi:hypothetical protein
VDALGPLAGFVWAWILPLALQATLLLAAAALLDRLRPRAVWPEVRLAALVVLLLRLLLPPSPGSVFPPLERAWPGGLSLDPGPFDALAPRTRVLGFAVATIWALGVGAAVLWEIVRARRRATLWRRAEHLDAGLSAALRAAGSVIGLPRVPEARVVSAGSPASSAPAPAHPVAGRALARGGGTGAAA